MRFADPYLLALLAAIPVLLLLRLRISRSAPAGAYSSLELLSGARRTWRLRYRWLPAVIGAVGIALLVIGLARPQNGEAESAIPGQGVDIAFALDTSGSMSTYFGDKPRLAVAQEVLTQFIEAREDDRFGLVIFRDVGLVLSPLTLDHDALTGLINRVDQVNLPDGTAIGVGLADSLSLLRESRARSRVAILLTDGENNAGDIEPLAAARIAETLGLRVYTIGLVERSNGGVNVDELALQEMAQITGGRYFAAENAESLTDIYNSIDQLEKSRVGQLEYVTYEEWASYFLAAALLFIALEVILNATLWKRA